MSVRVTCHCGAVELRVELAEPVSAANRCDCSFCSRRAAATVSARVENVEIVKGADALTLYQWGTCTARHYFCKVCGIYTHHRRRSDPGECGVNVGCIEGVDVRALSPGWHDGRNHPSDR
ncbi:GFA family protein [Rhodobacteraceae bacterium CCMM004]|nr:GFA family protein [Rhodobacteraceae bacterium CCMM004]